MYIHTQDTIGPDSQRCRSSFHTCDMRMGSEKSPPDDDEDSVGGVGRSFFDGGGPPSRPGFVEACLASSE